MANITLRLTSTWSEASFTGSTGAGPREHAARNFFADPQGDFRQAARTPASAGSQRMAAAARR